MNENLIRYEAFATELEKIAGPLSFLAKMVTRIVPKITKTMPRVRKAFGKIEKMAPKPAMISGFRSKGTTYNLGMRAMQKGKSMKTLFGKVDPSKLKVREIASPKQLFKSPGEWAKQKAGTVAQELKFIKDKGMLNYLSKDISRARHFTKTYKYGGKTYEVMGKRSLVGQVTNPLIGSTIGMTGLSYAVGGKTPRGKDVKTGKRMGTAATEGLMWAGPLAPITAPVMGAKIGIDIAKNMFK